MYPELDTNKPGHRQKKVICPACGYKHKYVRFFNFETFEYLPYEFGKCERIYSCGYFVKPGKEYHQKQNAWREPVKRNTVHQQPVKPSFIDYEIVSKTLQGYEHNVFVQYLVNTFGENWTYQAVKKYYIGTSKHWQGANIFWQVDSKNKIRTGKIMLYKPDGHRDKTKFASWAHSVLKIKNFNLFQCLFGEHLLNDANAEAITAIVESEKTAIIASYFFPKYIWLATGGETMLNTDKCKVLKGRKVVFFPDLSDNARERWQAISEQINKQYGIRSKVSSYLNNINDGSDIADKLLQMPIDKKFGNILNKHGYPASWDV